MNILVVEDDAFQCKIAVTLLKMYVNHDEVDTAMNCQEAREMVANTKYDLILMDYGLPDGNGLDLTKEFRAEGNNAKIYALSGNWDKVTDEAWKEAGFDGGSTKPFSKKLAEIYTDAVKNNSWDTVAWDNSFI